MSSVQPILIVEDEADVASSIAQRFASEGFTTEVVGDGESAVERALAIDPAVIILDIMLPGIDGYEVTRQVLEKKPIPILMLTARADEADKLIGLGVGADDYMTKPFSPRELVARVKALIRRVEKSKQIWEEKSPTIEKVYGDLTFDPARRQVVYAGQTLHLTPTEFDLLGTLIAGEGKVISRQDLLEKVWGWFDASDAFTRTIDSHIKSLRRKVGHDHIKTVHGVGYSFEA